MAGFSRADQEFAPIPGARVLVVAAHFNARVVALLREAGAEPVVLDGLDREAVITAVLAAA